VIWAVLDTNVVVSGFGWPGGSPGRVVDHALRGDFLSVTSPALVDELGRVLQYEKLEPFFPDPLGVALLWETTCAVVRPTVTVAVCRDEADNRMLETAVTGGADFVVTGDPDLLDLQEFEGVRIVSPKTFLEVLAAGG